MRKSNQSESEGMPWTRKNVEDQRKAEESKHQPVQPSIYGKSVQPYSRGYALSGTHFESFAVVSHREENKS